MTLLSRPARIQLGRTFLIFAGCAGMTKMRGRFMYMLKVRGLLKSAVVSLMFAAANIGSAGELSIEGNLDSTPSELRVIDSRAKALEAKMKEFDQRIEQAQKSIIGGNSIDTIDYRLELKPSEKEKHLRGMDFGVVVSHMRMSLNGRPFVYSQAPVLVTHALPLPLFIGRMPAGQHQIRIQFQLATVSPETFSHARTAWRTVDQVINIALSASAGRQQTQTIEISDMTMDDVNGLQARDHSQASPSIGLQNEEKNWRAQ